MKEIAARVLFVLSLITLMVSVFLLWQKQEPFHTYFFLFAWWSYIGLLDSWLYLRGGESLWIEKPGDFVCFLLPLSAFLWFIFEAFNLQMENWHYINVPNALWIRWAGNFLAFATVLPGLFLTANFLDHCEILRKNDFSHFFSSDLPGRVSAVLITLGLTMLLLPLLFPEYFFPLVWVGFVLLLDPVNAIWKRRSLIQEWRQKNWNRTLQLLLAGLVCGGLWEFWNFWAGAKWVYTVPLPEALGNNLKIFEMPILGFLGFPPFALECFVLTEFARGLREKVPAGIWKMFALGAFLFGLLMCRLLDLYTVNSYR